MEWSSKSDPRIWLVICFAPQGPFVGKLPVPDDFLLCWTTAKATANPQGTLDPQWPGRTPFLTTGTAAPLGMLPTVWWETLFSGSRNLHSLLNSTWLPGLYSSSSSQIQQFQLIMGLSFDNFLNALKYSRYLIFSDGLKKSWNSQLQIPPACSHEYHLSGEAYGKI